MPRRERPNENQRMENLMANIIGRELESLD